MVLNDPNTDVEGLDELNAYLDGLPDRILEGVTATGQAIAEMMKGTAVMLCPVAQEDGGRLRQSIESFVEVAPESMEAGAGTSVEYGGFVEYGTGLRGASDSGGYPLPAGISYNMSWLGMMAQPYLRPSLYDNEAEILESITSGVVVGVQK